MHSLRQLARADFRPVAVVAVAMATAAGAVAGLAVAKDKEETPGIAERQAPCWYQLFLVSAKEVNDNLREGWPFGSSREEFETDMRVELNEVQRDVSFVSPNNWIDHGEEKPVNKPIGRPVKVPVDELPAPMKISVIKDDEVDVNPDDKQGDEMKGFLIPRSYEGHPCPERHDVVFQTGGFERTGAASEAVRLEWTVLALRCERPTGSPGRAGAHAAGGQLTQHQLDDGTPVSLDACDCPEGRVELCGRGARSASSKAKHRGKRGAATRGPVERIGRQDG